MVNFLRTFPLPLSLLQMVLFFTPFFVHIYLGFELQHTAGNLLRHNLIEMVWFIYIFPSVIFAYYFFFKGALISSFILSFVHLIFEWIEHIVTSLSIEEIFSISVQTVLTFLVSYAVGLLSKKLNHKQIELEIANKKLEELAYYDTLTGLSNRRLFIQNLDKELNRQNENKKEIAVLFIDLDGFKKVNDTLGHIAGDLLLEEVAKRLKNCVRDKDTLSRLAGDEFTILLPSISHEETEQVAERILEILRTPYMIKNSEVKVTPSIGVAFSKNANNESETLIIHADLAMYQAKKKGKNNYQVYAAVPQI